MVAILGRIMPAPLLMPVRVMVALPSATRLETIFGRVSVVMMLRAAANQLSAARVAVADGKAATRRDRGRGSRTTTVKKGQNCWGARPRVGERSEEGREGEEGGGKGST